ncbi:MAG: hypothetical protein ACI4PF_02545 [Christensenellales bacterium]
MTYKNSIKILFSNFNIVWKMALYLLLLFAFLAFVIYLFISPIVEMINTAGFFNRFVELYTDFLTSLNLTALFDSVAELANEVIIFISNNISQLWFYFLGVGFIMFFFSCIACNLVNMASCTSLHLYMGSMTKQGFFASLSENFGKNLKIQLAYYFVTLPYNILGVVLLLLSFKLFNISWLVSLINVFAIIIGFVLFKAMKYTLFSAWIPTAVVMNFSIFKSLKMSIKIVFRRFGKVFGTAIGVVLTIICLNVILGLCSFMVGLLISIPISILLVNVFGMVVVYEGQGMRYYVDIYNVITPKKKEDSDKLKDMMHIV